MGWTQEDSDRFSNSFKKDGEEVAKSFDEAVEALSIACNEFAESLPPELLKKLEST